MQYANPILKNRLYLFVLKSIKDQFLFKVRPEDGSQDQPSRSKPNGYNAALWNNTFIVILRKRIFTLNVENRIRLKR